MTTSRSTAIHIRRRIKLSRDIFASGIPERIMRFATARHRLSAYEAAAIINLASKSDTLFKALVHFAATTEELMDMCCRRSLDGLLALGLDRHMVANIAILRAF